MELYEKVLKYDRSDYQSIWLYNVAAMTLGKYPDEISLLHQIPESFLKSDYEIPVFPNVSLQANVAVLDVSGGSIFEDFNGDGFLDLMVSAWPLTSQIRLLENNGDTTFREATDEWQLGGLTGGLNLVHADYDNDGDNDVLVLRGAWLDHYGAQPNSLLQNNGNGTFSDITQAVGLFSAHPTQTARWEDFNNDGFLDLFIGNETQNLADPHPCELYFNNGDGTFSEISEQSGVNIIGFVKGVATGDYDNDGYTDLYISILKSENILFRNLGEENNEGGWSFEVVTKEAGVAEPVPSFPCWFWDINNDGWQDLFVSGYQVADIGDVAKAAFGLPHDAVGPKIYLNHGDGTFRDMGMEHNIHDCWLPMGANYGDFDYDGFLDFYVGSGDTPMDNLLPNRLYRNASGKYFQDVTSSGNFGHLQKGHGVSFGDYDNDGDQDIHITMGGAYSGDRYINALFQNPAFTNSWIKLQLQGKTSNRNGIGARIKIEVREGNSTRTIHRTMNAGGSFGSNSYRMEIGLGDMDSIRSLEVYWPVSGETDRIQNIQPQMAYILKEGSGKLSKIPHPASNPAPPFDPIANPEVCKIIE